MSGAPMSATPVTISAITDISANIFALLILILIAMLAARAAAPPDGDAAPIIDVETDLAGVERSPLGSDALLDLLYGRREEATSTRIDLLGPRIDIAAGGKTEHFTTVGDAALRLRQLGASGRPPAGVYVFSPRFYRGVTETLAALGWTWREITVPEALRAPRSGATGEGWSAGFRELIARPSDREQFRAALARLLSASASERLGQGRQDAVAAAGHTSRRWLDAVARWSGAAVDAAAIGIGIAFVAWVEMRRKRKCRSAIPAGSPARSGDATSREGQ